MSNNQGTVAVKVGKKVEDSIENLILSKLGYEAEYFSRTKKRTNILLKNVPYKSIYEGSRCRSEFMLNHQGRNIRIECKSQTSPGYVDEKLPYLYLNFSSRKNDGEETIIIIEGNGFKKGATEWLKKSCERTSIQVFTITQFKEYLSLGLPKKNRSRVVSMFNKLMGIIS